MTDSGAIVWRKTINGQWCKVSGCNHCRQDYGIDIPGIFIERNKAIFATGELQEHFDSILENYRLNKGITGPPYEYWKKVYPTMFTTSKNIWEY
jgi:hypothetical protein